MKRYKGLITFLVMMLAAMPALGLFAERSQAATSRVAIIQSLTGTVQVKKAGGSKQFRAFAKMSLNEGDILSTSANSTAVLQFANGTSEDDRMTVSANTTLTFSKLSDRSGTRTKVSMWSGKAWVDVKSITTKNDEFTLETPTAIMGVRGTHLLVHVDPVTGTTRLTVAAGVVEATTSGSNESASVKPGDNALVTKDNQNSGEITIAPADLELLMQQSDSAIVEAIVAAAGDIVKENEEKLDAYFEDDETQGTELDRKKSNVENLLGAIVDSAIRNGAITEERVNQLVAEAQAQTGVSIDLSKKNLTLSDEEIAQQDEQRRKEEEAAEQAGKEAEEQLSQNEELRRQLEEERQRKEEEIKRIEEEKRRQAEERYMEQLDEAEKGQFEERRQETQSGQSSPTSSTNPTSTPSPSPSPGPDLSQTALTLLKVTGSELQDNILFKEFTNFASTNWQGMVPLPASIDSFVIHAVTADPDASVAVKVDGDEYGMPLDQQGDYTVFLYNGLVDKVDIEVTAPDGITQRTYTLQLQYELESSTDLIVKADFTRNGAAVSKQIGMHSNLQYGSLFLDYGQNYQLEIQHMPEVDIELWVNGIQLNPVNGIYSILFGNATQVAQLVLTDGESTVEYELRLSGLQIPDGIAQLQIMGFAGGQSQVKDFAPSYLGDNGMQVFKMYLGELFDIEQVHMNMKWQEGITSAQVYVNDIPVSAAQTVSGYDSSYIIDVYDSSYQMGFNQIRVDLYSEDPSTPEHSFMLIDGADDIYGPPIPFILFANELEVQLQEVEGFYVGSVAPGTETAFLHDLVYNSFSEIRYFPISVYDHQEGKFLNPLELPIALQLDEAVNDFSLMILDETDSFSYPINLRIRKQFAENVDQITAHNATQGQAPKQLSFTWIDRSTNAEYGMVPRYRIDSLDEGAEEIKVQVDFDEPILSFWAYREGIIDLDEETDEETGTYIFTVSMDVYATYTPFNVEYKLSNEQWRSIDFIVVNGSPAPVSQEINGIGVGVRHGEGNASLVDAYRASSNHYVFYMPPEMMNEVLIVYVDSNENESDVEIQAKYISGYDSGKNLSPFGYHAFDLFLDNGKWNDIVIEVADPAHYQTPVKYYLSIWIDDGALPEGALGTSIDIEQNVLSRNDDDPMRIYYDMEPDVSEIKFNLSHSQIDMELFAVYLMKDGQMTELTADGEGYYTFNLNGTSKVAAVYLNAQGKYIVYDHVFMDFELASVELVTYDDEEDLIVESVSFEGNEASVTLDFPASDFWVYLQIEGNHPMIKAYVDGFLAKDYGNGPEVHVSQFQGQSIEIELVSPAGAIKTYTLHVDNGQQQPGN